MTITYELGHALYVNITNRCSNDCVFCIRNDKSSVNGADNLWLEREPSVEEILEDIEKRDLSQYRELVFCGFGEPTYRFFDIIEVAKVVKKKWEIPTRINSNGHANRINGEDVTPLLKDVIDTVSISLNAVSHEKYNEICQPMFEDGFEEMLDFAKRASQYSKVVLTVVDILKPEEIEASKKIAESIGVELRIRSYIES